MNKRLPFTQHLYTFLIQTGYTLIQLRGIDEQPVTDHGHIADD